MPYDYTQNGNASYRSWAHIPVTTPILEEPDNSIPWEDRKYAQLVYLVGGPGVNPITVEDPQFTTKIEVDGDTIYVAEATPGSVEGDSVWRCKKIEIVGVITTIKWANGNTNFSNAATNLSVLTYE
jgi:hypothetical protein